MMSPEDLTDERLAAYLAGDVDDLTARRIESRLVDDAELGARLDRLGDALVALRTPDAVEPPAGLRERLLERVDAEEPAPRRAAPPVRRWYGAVGAVAAGIVALALLGGGLAGLGLDGLGGQEDAAEVATDADTMDAPERHAEDEAEDSGATTQEGSDAPMASDDDASEEEESALQDGEADDDLGTQSGQAPPITVAEAERTADRRWDELPERVAACREPVEDAAPQPSVPLDARHEVIGERRVMVYELATVVGEGEWLDATAEVIADAESCEVLEAEVRP